MAKNSKIRRPVLFSTIAIAICFTMLIGTTFAWFTASVTSTDNVIKSGKLDISLEYLADTATGKGWKSAENVDNILDPDALYEPGYVSLNFVRVANLGNLALKYQLVAYKESEKSGINKAGEAFFLSDYLVFKFVKLEGEAKDKVNDGNVANYTRASTVALLGNDLSTGYNVPNVVNALLPESTTSDAKDIYALIVYMPESVGNNANARTPAEAPEITLTLKVVATQYSYEKDSFDEYYDETAFNNDWNIYQYITGDISTGLSAYETEFDPEPRVTVTNAALANTNVTLSVSECNTPYGIQVLAGTTYKSYDISVKDDTGVTPDGTYTVSMFIEKGLTQNIVLYHDGKTAYTKDTDTYSDPDISDVSYDIATGYLTFNTKSFSPFTVAAVGAVAMVKGTNQWYDTVQKAIDAAPNNDTVVLTAYDLSGDFVNAAGNYSQQLVISSAKDLTLDLNGCRLSTNKKQMLDVYGKLEIIDSAPKGTGILSGKGGSIEIGEDDDVTTGLITVRENGGELTINGGTIKASNTDTIRGARTIYVRSGSTPGSTPGKLVINDGRIISSANNTNNGPTAIDNNGICEINGGQIECIRLSNTDVTGTTSVAGISSSGTLTITNGSVSVYSNSGVRCYGVSAAGQVNISGGTIKAEINENITTSNVSQWGVITLSLGQSGSINISGGTFEAIGYKATGISFNGNPNSLPSEPQHTISSATVNVFCRHEDVNANNTSSATGIYVNKAYAKINAGVKVNLEKVSNSNVTVLSGYKNANSDFKIEFHKDGSYLTYTANTYNNIFIKPGSISYEF